MKPTHFAFLALASVAQQVAFAADRAIVTGKVADTSWKAVEHATVMIYEAFDKQGTRANCPTCRVDCGKRTTTDDGGGFRIADVDPQLEFTLLILRDGFSAAYLRNVDPAVGPADTASLAIHPVIKDERQLVRGKVIDSHGGPVRDAVVQQQGVGTLGGGHTFGGGRDWIDDISSRTGMENSKLRIRNQPWR